eukprot:Nk52_evm1s1391 gene=Nk52_evmTU1s1391
MVSTEIHHSDKDDIHRGSMSAKSSPKKKQQQQDASWDAKSWRKRKAHQQPEYKDTKKLKSAVCDITNLPPLVASGEVDSLKNLLAEAADGKAFVLQGGDCAELFEYCNAEHIENKLKILLQMSLVLCWGARTPVVRIARMAGQYAKPRSSNTEMVNGKEVLSYRGDHINSIDPEDREADPERLKKAYFYAASTMNYVRALSCGGFADIRDPHQWDLSTSCKNKEAQKVYDEFSERIRDSIDFISVIDGEAVKRDNHAFKTADFYSSHEGLLLEYEEALTRTYSGKSYNVGAHFLWIGDRTRQLDGAHVEYFRGIANPIGVKVGPSMKDDELVSLLKLLNPHNEKGKITLITRYGKTKVREYLPGHIRAVQKSGCNVTWICDPMHGNTEKSSVCGLKTRDFDNILGELRHCFAVHKENGSRLNGVHFELTGENVTECLGGSNNLTEADLSKNYTTFCDPRLNYTQSIDMALLIAKYHQKERQGFKSL